jgi:hypothetical protein
LEPIASELGDADSPDEVTSSSPLDMTKEFEIPDGVP